MRAPARTRLQTEALFARGATGAAVGWVAVKIPQTRSQKKADAREETAVLGYTLPQGTVVKLQNAAIDPTYCRRGEEVRFSMEYTLLAPPDTPTMPVTERWVILKEGATQITLDNGTHERDQGQWVSQASIHLPQQI